MHHSGNIQSHLQCHRRYLNHGQCYPAKRTLSSAFGYSSLPQSPHAHEFYVVRLYSQDDLWNNKELLESLIKDSLKARQKNKLITKRKNLSKKQLKLEYLN